MTNVTVVDTDILIDAGRGVAEALTCLDKVLQQSSIGVSAVTQMELFIGCRNKTELTYVDTFLNQFRLIQLTNQTSDTAVGLIKQYRLSHGLLIPDALIAATALTLDAPLISKNQRDYRFIPNLNLLPYP